MKPFALAFIFAGCIFLLWLALAWAFTLAKAADPFGIASTLIQFGLALLAIAALCALAAFVVHRFIKQRGWDNG